MRALSTEAKTLRDRLEGARIVMHDEVRKLTLTWYGGHGIHAWDRHGREVAFWNVGSLANYDADEVTVRRSMERHISGEEEYSWILTEEKLRGIR